MVLDAGAYVGDFAVKAAGKARLVVACEPTGTRSGYSKRTLS